MDNLSTKALYTSLKLTRKLINISFLIIFVVLLIWGNANPAAIFSIIFYNALYWLLMSNQKKYLQEKKAADSAHSSELIELNVLKITFTAAVLLHLLLGYGFMHRLTISRKEVKNLPLVLIAVIIIFRYLSHFIIRLKLKKKDS